LVKGTEEKEENDSTEQMSFFDMVETPEPAYDCCESPNIVMESGCETCKVCGWSMCHVA